MPTTATPRLSVITPVYKTGKLLLETMDCLARQGDVALEWILVNDGSKDAPTLEALQTIATTAPFPASVFHLENGGACRARNYGLRQARGAHVKFLDADDLLEPGLLALQAKLAHEHPGAVIAGPEKQVYDDGSGTMRVLAARIPEQIPDDMLAATLRHPVFHHSALLIPRELVERIGGYDESLLADQDGDFMLRLFWEKPSVVYDRTAAFLFRQHNLTERISGTSSPAKVASRYAVYTKIKQRLTEAGRLEAYRPALAAKLYRVAGRTFSTDARLAQAYVDEALALDPHLRLHPRPLLHLLIRTFGFSRVKTLIQRFKK